MREGRDKEDRERQIESQSSFYRQREGEGKRIERVKEVVKREGGREARISYRTPKM